MSGAGWRVVGASVRGTAHQKRGQPCQDAHTWRELPPAGLLLCLADGAGSVPHAAQGARLAVDEACRHLEGRLREDGPPASVPGWERLLEATFEHSRQALLDLAAEAGQPPQHFATTLLCAVATPRWLALAQIGDGLAVSRAAQGELFTALAPQRGEYANETHFLTGEAAPLSQAIYPQGVQALSLMSDGLSRLAVHLDSGQPHPPFFEPLLAFAAGPGDPATLNEQLAAFLESERVCARTDDDKTLLLAVREGGA